MSHAVAVLVTLIITAFICAAGENGSRKDYAEAGMIVIDKVAYRLVPVGKQ